MIINELLEVILIKMQNLTACYMKETYEKRVSGDLYYAFQIKIKKEPSFISCILSFILLYIPILLTISLITEIFNITKGKLSVSNEK